MHKKVHILVEGPTENAFVKQLLLPYFEAKKIYINPIIIRTKENIHGANYKGGISSYEQIKRELRPLLNDSSFDIVTTMIDYYALPGDFPKFAERPAGTCYQRVDFAERAFKENISNKKFIPYLQLHEFEALVFACEDKISAAFSNAEKKIARVNAINSEFESPEEINENYDTAPSRRLKTIFGNYQKVFHSQLILSKSNIENIRSKCPHFNSWLEKLES